MENTIKQRVEKCNTKGPLKNINRTEKVSKRNEKILSTITPTTCPQLLEDEFEADNKQKTKKQRKNSFTMAIDESESTNARPNKNTNNPNEEIKNTQYPSL